MINIVLLHPHYLFNVLFYTYIYCYNYTGYNAFNYLFYFELIHFSNKNIVRKLNILPYYSISFNLAMCYINWVLITIISHIIEIDSIVLNTLLWVKLVWSGANVICVSAIFVMVILAELFLTKEVRRVYLLNYCSFLVIPIVLFHYTKTVVEEIHARYQNYYINTNTTKYECNICLEEINNNHMKLKCGHQFHQACITKWLSSGRCTCPTCRALVDLPLTI